MTSEVIRVENRNSFRIPFLNKELHPLNAVTSEAATSEAATTLEAAMTLEAGKTSGAATTSEAANGVMQ